MQGPPTDHGEKWKEEKGCWWGDDLEGSPSELVLVHDATSPQGTAEILAARSTERHHHVRNRSSEDVARVARIVRGESTGVVFGGGGARGFAHLGVLKAMIELGIEKYFRDAAVFLHMDATVDVSAFKIIKMMFPETAGAYAGPE